MSNAEAQIDNTISGAIADAAGEWVPVTARFEAARLARERLNLAEFVAPSGDGREAVIDALRASFFAENGCGSDMQEANLEWDEDGKAVRFYGEGSVDVGHIVDEVFIALESLSKEGLPDD